MSDSPVVVAYDGSAVASAAVRAAATLFGGRQLKIATVWEPGLAMALAASGDPSALAYSLPTYAETVAVDRSQRDQAAEAAEQGARLARELGASAEACPLPDDDGIPRTIAAFAAGCGACAVVVGSRGLRGIKSRLLGSTSRGLLEDAQLPIVVVKHPGDSDPNPGGSS
jgi:nucleotide-binding universal stress UspA family protein